MKFFVLTRWAVALWSDHPPDAAWVAGRRKFLLEVTAPSLRAQSDPDFTWLLYVDERYAEGERLLLEQALGDAVDFEVVAVEGRLTPEAIEEPILGRAQPGDLIATARLDSDDALAPGYIERMKGQLSAAHPPVSVDFPDGVMVDVDRGIPLRRPYFSSPVQTLLAEVTPGSRIMTGLHLDHSRVAESVPYRAVRTDRPQWFMSIHGLNTTSRAYGIPKPASVVPPHLRDGLAIRETTSLARSVYLVELTLHYAGSLAREGDTLGRVRRAGRALRPQLH